MADRIAITISRQFCCGGAKIGNIVASQLGYYYADREVLQLAAQQLGITVEELSWRDERLTSFWENITGLFTYGIPDVSYTAPPFRTFTDEHLFELECKIIQKLAERNDCVIVGRGGVHVLKNHPGAVHVFLHAPMKFRIRIAMQSYDAPNEEKAESMIRESDRMRQEYLARMAKYDWYRSTKYHLVMDTSVITPEQAADIIGRFVNYKTLHVK